MQKVELIELVTCAAQTMLLKFKRPRDYVFEAGQFAYVTLIQKKYGDVDHHERILSFASAPNDPTLDFIVRIRDSGYKKELSELKTGDSVFIGPPMGNFVFPANHTPIICLAGGVGSSPFLSLIKEGIRTQNQSLVTLIWSNQTQETIPLFNQTQSLVEQWPNARLISVLTRQSTPPPPHRSGRIDAVWLKNEKLIDPDATYLICGPTSFVMAISNGLNLHTIGDDRIKIEAFTGY